MTIKKIMAIDDSKTEQFLNEFIIEKFDPKVELVQAYDGEEALELIKSMETIPDLILLDINMPGMNGFEFLEKFSERQSESPVVIMLSSSEQNSDKDKALGFECVKEYLLKPLSVEKLQEIAKNS